MRKIITTILATCIIPTAFGCFIMFLTDGKNIFVANHEDWYGRDAEVTFVPATGKKMVYAVILIWRFTNNKLCEHWSVSDVYGMLQQSGVIRTKS